jgi:hypothetical protein
MKYEIEYLIKRMQAGIEYIVGFLYLDLIIYLLPNMTLKIT